MYTSDHFFQTFCDTPLAFNAAALWIVTPPNSDAAEPVVAVKKNVRSLHLIETTQQNSKQNRCATVMHVLLPAPAKPVRYIISCS